MKPVSCKALKKDGSRCRATALPESGFCFFHDPAKAAERHAAQSFGGSQNRMKTLGADAPDLKIADCQDVVRLLSETINQVRKGQLDPRVANAVGYLANVLIKSVQQGELESRLAELESLVKGRKNVSLEMAMMGTDA
jgi:hypothetical protein